MRSALPEDLASDLRRVLVDSGLSRVADAVVARGALPSVRLWATVAGEGDPPLGASRLGGRPDLHAGWSWPETGPGVLGAGTRGESRPLAFVGRLNLADVAPYEAERALPDRGMLYFFADALGFDPTEQLESYRARQVLYHPSAEGLRRAPFPDGLPEECRFFARSVEFHREATLPPHVPNEPEDVARLGFGGDFTPEEDAAYEGLHQRLTAVEGGYRVPVHRLLGHAQPIGHDDMQLECELETHGLRVWDEGPRVEALGAAEWRLLLQVDSEGGEDGFMWGDVGKNFYWIRAEDLRDRRFEGAWLILQSH